MDPQNYQLVEADTNEEYLLKLFENEIIHLEERKVNLLLGQATLPKVSGKPFGWKEVQMAPGLSKEYVISVSTLIALNLIKNKGKKVKFYTVAGLVNALLEANEKGLLGRFFKQIEKLDLLILDELCIALHNSSMIIKLYLSHRFSNAPSLCSSLAKRSSSTNSAAEINLTL